MKILSNRTALVTGAAGGFGRVICKALVENGASVLAADVDGRGLEALAAATPGSLETRVLDISDPAACAAAVEHARTRFGSLDILVNNGAMGMGAFRSDHMTRLVGIEEIDPAMWDRFIRVNHSGAWYLTKAAYPAMKAKGWGRVVNVTASFFTMLRGSFHPYGPAKAGLEAMSAGHAAEFAGTGVTVNVVVPGGPADTPIVPAEAPYSRGDLIAPAKMLAPIPWLCSAEADAATGKRYIAANWDESKPVAQARAASEAGIAWPELAATPVWPGGKPKA